MAATFEAPASHEMAHEAAHEWEWEHPEAQEWETHEWEHPEAHEWETHEWEASEADPFFGGLKRRLLKGVAGLARRVAPGAIRALAGMIPGVGAIAGPLLGQLTQRLV